MKARVEQVIGEYASRHVDRRLECRLLSAADPWQVEVTFALAPRGPAQTGLPGMGDYTLRSLRAEDVRALQAFGRRLSPGSKRFFSPYPWADELALGRAFAHAIRQSTTRVDVSYLLFHGTRPAGHFFLWKATHNPLSQRFDVQIPELGIAIADAYQGQGLGRLGVQFLKGVAEELGADAIELSTAQENNAGCRTYLSAGYEQTGLIRIPLDVDVTAALAGEVTAARWRDERQMVLVLRPAKRAAVLTFLEYERTESLRLGEPDGSR